MIRASVKNVCDSCVDFEICQRMVSIRKLSFMTLTYFLKVKYNISETIKTSAKMFGNLLYILTFAIKWCQCGNGTS